MYDIHNSIKNGTCITQKQGFKRFGYVKCVFSRVVFFYFAVLQNFVLPWPFVHYFTSMLGFSWFKSTIKTKYYNDDKWPLEGYILKLSWNFSNFIFLILSFKMLNSSISNTSSQPKFQRRSSSYKRETGHTVYCYVNNWKARAMFLFTYWMLIRKYKFLNKEIWKFNTKIVTMGV